MSHPLKPFAERINPVEATLPVACVQAIGDRLLQAYREFTETGNTGEAASLKKSALALLGLDLHPTPRFGTLPESVSIPDLSRVSTDLRVFEKHVETLCRGLERLQPDARGDYDVAQVPRIVDSLESDLCVILHGSACRPGLAR